MQIRLQLSSQFWAAITIQNAFDRIADAAAGLDVDLALSHLNDYTDPLIQARLLVQAASGMVRQAEINCNREKVERARKQALEELRASRSADAPR